MIFPINPLADPDPVWFAISERYVIRLEDVREVIIFPSGDQGKAILRSSNENAVDLTREQLERLLKALGIKHSGYSKP